MRGSCFTYFYFMAMKEEKKTKEQNYPTYIVSGIAHKIPSIL